MNQPTNLNLNYIIGLVEDVAREYNIDEKEAELLVRIQFDWIKEEMRELGVNKAVKLKHIGKFQTNSYRVNMYNERHAENKGNSTGILESRTKDNRNTTE